MTDRLLTVGDVAQALGCAPKSIRNSIWQADHGLPHSPIPPFARLGRRLVVRASDFERWLDDNLRPIQKLCEGEADPVAP